MPIISKPRQIRINLDPDQGFPVGVSVESTRYVEEDGVNIADLPPHVDTYDVNGDGKELKKVMNAVQVAAVAALIPYQQEVQRIASMRDQIQADRDALRAERDALKAAKDIARTAAD